MKAPTSAALILAATSPALASWLDWIDPVTTVTVSATRTVTYCPCNGELVTAVSPGQFVTHTTTKAVWDPTSTTTTTTVGGGTITKAGPIVYVFENAGIMTTKTGVKIELHPVDTAQPTVTKTVWTGPLPTDDMEWVDWNDDDPDNAGTLTRTHTAYTTLFEAAPTDTAAESWSDWIDPDSTRTWTETDTTYVGVSPTGGPGGASTTTTSGASASSTTGGPIGATTSSSTSTSTTSGSTTTTDSTTTTTSGVGEPASTSTTSTTTSVAPTTTTTTTSIPVAETTTTTSATTTTTSTQNQGPTLVDVSAMSYINGILTAHNIHRRNHSASDLTWSVDQANTAAQIAATCIYGHSMNVNGGGYGQNIGAGYLPAQVPAMIGNDMYNGEMPFYPLPYGNNNPPTGNFLSWGHFSQIVWASTTQVGCATQYCANGLANAGSGVLPYFTVCNYAPPGNVDGQYSNVGAPLGQPIAIIVTS